MRKQGVAVFFSTTTYAEPRVAWTDGDVSLEADSLPSLEDELQRRFSNNDKAQETLEVCYPYGTCPRPMPHTRFLPRTAPLPASEKKRVHEGLEDLRKNMLGKPFRQDDESWLVTNPRILSSLSQLLALGNTETLFWQIGEWLWPGYVNQLFEQGHPIAEIALISGRNHIYPPFTTEGALDNLELNWLGTMNSATQEEWQRSPFQNWANRDLVESMRTNGLWFRTVFPDSATSLEQVIKNAISYDYYIIARVPDVMLFSTQLGWQSRGEGILPRFGYSIPIVLNPLPPSLILAEGKRSADTPWSDSQAQTLTADMHRRYENWGRLRAELFRSID